MPTRAPWTEQFQHFVTEVRDPFWGDRTRQTRVAWQQFFERASVAARDRYVGVREDERSPARADARNGFYERDFVTPLGTLRLRIARPRRHGVLPAGIARLQRRAAAGPLLIREACLRGVSTRPVGQLSALLPEEPVRARRSRS